MKNPVVAILLSAASLLGACSTPPDPAVERVEFTPYLGQSPPGESAVLFAPGLVSVEGRYEYGVSFSPEGRELLFTAQGPEGPSALRHVIAAKDGWAGAEEVHLSEGQKAEEMEAFFTPDGRRIYFAAYNEGLDVRIWAADRHEGGWSLPRQMGPPMADDPAFFPTTTAGGAVYYSNLAKRRIFRAEIAGPEVAKVEDTGLEAMHAFIAPDESFVLLDVRAGGKDDDSDIYVSFRQPDGSWSPRADLGPGVNTEFDETCPSLSPDGRFVFFSRYNEPGELSNIYWVSASVLQKARESLEADRAAKPRDP